MPKRLQTGLQASIFTAALMLGSAEAAHGACADYNDDGKIDAVIAEGDAGLRRIIRKLMVGEPFEQFVIEAANDRLLTDKYLIKQSSSFSALKGEYEYPDLYKRVNQVRAIYGEETANDVWYRTNAALAREPLQLFVNIAKYEKPYTEIVNRAWPRDDLLRPAELGVGRGDARVLCRRHQPLSSGLDLG